MCEKSRESEEFSDFSQPLMLASWQVYSDLAYKKIWKSVELLPCHPLKMPYIVAQEDEGCPRQIFVPVRAMDDLSMEAMDGLLEHVGNGVDGVPQRSVVLAIVDSDSTIVYYALQDGIAAQDDRAVRAVELTGDDNRPMTHRKKRGEKRKRNVP